MEDTMLFDRLRRWGADPDDGLRRFLSDRELYGSCLRSFLSDGEFDALYAAFAAGDEKGVFENAHGLKGVTGNLSLSPLYVLTGEIVADLRAGRKDRLPGQVADLRRLEQEFRALMEDG